MKKSFPLLIFIHAFIPSCFVLIRSLTAGRLLLTPLNVFMLGYLADKLFESNGVGVKIKISSSPFSLGNRISCFRLLVLIPEKFIGIL